MNQKFTPKQNGETDESDAGIEPEMKQKYSAKQRGEADERYVGTTPEIN